MVVVFILFIKVPQTQTIFKQNIAEITSPDTTINYNLANHKLTGLIDKFLSENSNYQIDAKNADININYQPIDLSRESGNFFTLSPEPLVPVIHPQTILDNITLSEMQSIADGIDIGEEHFDTLVVIESMKNQIVSNMAINPEHILSFKTANELIDQIAINPNYLGLVPISQLSVAVHPLKVENISALTDPDQFPIQIDIFISKKFENDPLIRYLSDNYVPTLPTEILAVGDIMMGRFVGVKINRSGDPTHSVEYVWEELIKPDITFAQLETPIAPTEFTSEGMILVAQSDTFSALNKSGIDIVSISGNHFGDSLRDGMQSTFDILNENNIKYVGAGENEDRAFSHQIIEKDGVKYGFLTFVNIMPDSYGAEGDIAGSAWVDFNDIYDRGKIISSIQKARAEADILFVGFHWGTEYTPNPTLIQQEIAHLAIDNGADMVIGTHPHVVQADEIYKGKYINYSLGNFIMDQMWSEETQEGVLLYIYTIDNQIISTDLIPTHVIDYSQVKIIGKEEGSHILQRIWDASNELS